MNTDKAKQIIQKAGLHLQTEANPQLLAQSLGQAVAATLASSIDKHSSASLVVSGGSTPAPVLNYLSTVDIDWSRVTVTLADERWVPLTHADSNEALVRSTLLTEKAANARFVSLYRNGNADDDALRAVTQDVASMGSPFTVVMLGMGGDGHTASLFPDAPAAELAAAMALDTQELVAFLHPPSVGQTRISLTRAALLRSTHRFLHITGTGKLDVLHDALVQCNGDSYKTGDKPVVGLITENPESASVFWSASA